MLKVFEKYLFLFSTLLVLASLYSLFIWPLHLHLSSLLIIVLSFSFTIFTTSRRYWFSYQQAECTREKMIRNLTLDLLGLVLTMAAAMYVGRLAGGYFGLRAGFWVGLLTGFLGGFMAASVARSVWGKLVALE